MRINTNISALRAGTNLSIVEKNLSKSTERLSSGYKINRAYDDAAGFSISRKMRTQIKALERAKQNAADGISVIQTAEGALNEVSAMLNRMKELSVQAANDTNSGEDREAIQKEINALIAEIDRISTDNDFNTKTLLNGDVGRKGVSDVFGVSPIRVDDRVQNGDYEINIERDPRQAVLLGSDGDAANFDPTDGISVGGRIKINGEVIDIRVGDSMEEVYNKIRIGGERAGITVVAYGSGPDADGDKSIAGYTKEEFSEGVKLLFVSKEYGEKAEIRISADNEELAKTIGIKQEEVRAKGVDAKISLGNGFDKTATVSVNGDRAVIKDKNGFEMDLKLEKSLSNTTFNDMDIDGGSPDIIDGEIVGVRLSILDAGYMTLQVGANEGDSFNVSIDRMDSETLGIKNLNIRTNEEAEKAITLVDRAISMVSAERSKLGAFQNRLEHTMLSVDQTTEDMTAAFVRIMDTDMAKEMTELTQNQVLSQAGTSVLAQANERPNTILTLLQG